MTTPTVDLSNCDKEQIHQINYVQGHGAFLAISTRDLKVRNASENLGTFLRLGGTGTQQIGRKLNELLPLDLTTSVQHKLRLGKIRKGAPYAFTYQLPEKVVDLWLYLIEDELLGIELEENQDQLTGDEEERLSAFIAGLQRPMSLEQMCTEACRAVRSFANLDRVMVYRFFPPSMYGEVVGEDKLAGIQSFLHHRFPASDIPRPARELYLRNKVRFIHDSHGENSDIHPKLSLTQKALDLSDSRLRGVSSIHLEYLRNMGVRCSFSVAIIVEEKLWGIIACHSEKPLLLSHATRRRCLTIANTLALGAPMLERSEQARRELGFHDRLRTLFLRLKASDDPLDAFFRSPEEVCALFNCGGYALVTPEQIDLGGLTPSKAELRPLAQELLAKLERENRSVYATEALGSSRAEACGALVVRPSALSESLLMFLRPELEQSIQWGGDPRKNLNRNYQGTINPRASFETWTEVVKGHSFAWEEHEVSGAAYLKGLLFDALLGKKLLQDELSQRLRR
jgi:light-regulated signal transduction histidine kinase (bacteriophytochrome)